MSNQIPNLNDPCTLVPSQRLWPSSNNQNVNPNSANGKSRKTMRHLHKHSMPTPFDSIDIQTDSSRTRNFLKMKPSLTPQMVRQEHNRFKPRTPISPFKRRVLNGKSLNNPFQSPGIDQTFIDPRGRSKGASRLDQGVSGWAKAKQPRKSRPLAQVHRRRAPMSFVQGRSQNTITEHERHKSTKAGYKALKKKTVPSPSNGDKTGRKKPARKSVNLPQRKSTSAMTSAKHVRPNLPPKTVSTKSAHKLATKTPSKISNKPPKKTLKRRSLRRASETNIKAPQRSNLAKQGGTRCAGEDVLDLSGNVYSHSQLELALSSNLADVRLRTLVLRGCRIDDTGLVVVLSEILRNKAMIGALDLSDNNLTVASLGTVQEFLKMGSGLQQIWIRNNFFVNSETQVKIKFIEISFNCTIRV